MSLHAQTSFLGIPVLDIDIDGLVIKVHAEIRTGHQTQLLTLNPDQFLTAVEIKEYRDLYGRAELVIADGIGILIGSMITGQRIRHRIPGVELMSRLCDLASLEGLRIFLLGSTPDVLRKASERLVLEHPGLRIVGSAAPFLGSGESAEENEILLTSINAAAPHILFVAFGAPKQDLWIDRNRRKLNARCLMGVGASFDFIAGTQIRAPRWLQVVGLEWLFRLASEPRRLWRRYLLGIPRFFFEVVTYRLKGS